MKEHVGEKSKIKMASSSVAVGVSFTTEKQYVQ